MSVSGTQGGDPAKLAAGLLTIASEAKPPKHWIAGADAIAEIRFKSEPVAIDYLQFSKKLVDDNRNLLRLL